MQSFESQKKEAENWTFAVEKVEIKKDAVNAKTIKNSQFAKPYFFFEFFRRLRRLRRNAVHQTGHSAGDRIYHQRLWLSSAVGGSTPLLPLTAPTRGALGPAWGMPLLKTTPNMPTGS